MHSPAFCLGLTDHANRRGQQVYFDIAQSLRRAAARKAVEEKQQRQIKSAARSGRRGYVVSMTTRQSLTMLKVRESSKVKGQTGQARVERFHSQENKKARTTR